jgi:hypothetical protein
MDMDITRPAHREDAEAAQRIDDATEGLARGRRQGLREAEKVEGEVHRRGDGAGGEDEARLAEEDEDVVADELAGQITPAPMTAKKVALACASSDPETRSESATEVRPVLPHMVTATQPKVRPRTTSQ